MPSRASCSPGWPISRPSSRAATGPGSTPCWPTRDWRPIRDKLTGPVLPTPDPRLRVLQAFPDQFRAVAITLNELA